jgi:hypothetical protein
MITSLENKISRKTEREWKQRKFAFDNQTLPNFDSQGQRQEYSGCPEDYNSIVKRESALKTLSKLFQELLTVHPNNYLALLHADNLES